MDSVVNQTLREIEIICINDCTPDNSFEIVKEYAAKDSRFVLIEHETNQGQGIARNRGLDIASGNYIMFLDPDDWYEPEALEKAYNQISKNKNDIVFFTFKDHRFKNNKIVKSKIRYDRLAKFQSVMENNHINLMEFEEDWITASYTWAQIYSRDFLNKNNIRFPEERFTEDIPFFIKSVVCSRDISILNEPIYNSLRKVDTVVYDYFKHYEDVFSAKSKARAAILESENTKKFWINYLLYEIRSDLTQMKKFCRRNKDAKLHLYPKIRARFQENTQYFLTNDFDNEKFYKEFKIIVKSKTYKEFRIRRFLMKIIGIV